VPTVRTRSAHGVHGLPFLGQDSGVINIADPTVLEDAGLSTHGFTDYGASVPATVPQDSSPIYATFGPYGTTMPASSFPTLPPGPSPRVPVTPPTFPTTSVLSSLGQFLTSSTLIKGIPNAAVLGFGVLALSSGGGGRRRR